MVYGFNSQFNFQREHQGCTPETHLSREEAKAQTTGFQSRVSKGEQNLSRVPRSDKF